MKKKLLVAACAVSMMALCACNLPIVSVSQYDAVVAEKDAYIEECSELASEVESYETEVESLNSEVTDLQTEIALLQTENLNLSSELEDALALAEYSGLGEEVVYDITEDVALKFRLPEGFQYYGNDTYYVNYEDSSNIMVRVEESMANELDFTKQEMEEALLGMYDYMGLKVTDFEIKTFEKSTVEGCKTLTLDMSYVIEGQEVQQVEFIVQVEDTSCAIVYTTASEFGWYEEFLKSVETIQLGFVE